MPNEKRDVMWKRLLMALSNLLSDSSFHLMRWFFLSSSSSVSSLPSCQVMSCPKFLVYVWLARLPSVAHPMSINPLYFLINVRDSQIHTGYLYRWLHSQFCVDRGLFICYCQLWLKMMHNQNQILNYIHLLMLLQKRQINKSNFV